MIPIKDETGEATSKAMMDIFNPQFIQDWLSGVCLLILIYYVLSDHGNPTWCGGSWDMDWEGCGGFWPGKNDCRLLIYFLALQVTCKKCICNMKCNCIHSCYQSSWDWTLTRRRRNRRRTTGAESRRGPCATTPGQMTWFARRTKGRRDLGHRSAPSWGHHLLRWI